jgi:hypothetical protein
MKKRNLDIIVRNGLGKKSTSSGNRFFVVRCAFYAILLFPLISYGITGSPIGNVNLSGRYYLYPVGLEGNPYLFEDWKSANILLENGKIAEGEKVKFNIISNDLLFYNEDLKRVFVVDRGTIKNFTINPGTPDSLFFIKYIGENIGYKLKENDFIHVLQSGAISFFVKNSADIVNASDVNSKDRIYPKAYYFLQTRNGFFEIELNVNSIIKLFPERKKEIKMLAKTNKIKRNSVKSITKLIGLFNNQFE